MVAILKEQRISIDPIYLTYAMDAMTIDGDDDGNYYCMVPASDFSINRHQVRFIDPAKGRPYATECDCEHREFSPYTDCSHIVIVDTYFEMIYNGHAPNPAQEDMTVAEHLIEQEMHDYEVMIRYEGIKDLRMRVGHAGLAVRSRESETLVQALLAHRRSELVSQMSPECPQDDKNVPSKELTRADVISRVHEGLRILTHLDDDYASEDNGVGFSGHDCEFGHELAARRELTTKQVLAAAKMLQKYNRTQLGGIVPPMAVVEKVFAESASLNGNRGFSLMR